MPEPNEIYAKIQSIRVKNLEQQVNLMRRELQRIREGLLSQKDFERLTSLSSRLKELNDILKEIKNHYNMEKAKYHHKEGLHQPLMSRMNLELTEHQEDKFEHVPLGTKFFEENSKESNENYQDIAKIAVNSNSVTQIKHLPNENESNCQGNGMEKNSLGNDMKTDTNLDDNKQFKTCKQLMEEIKPPGSILGNYFMRLQDFRTDPELRRQRWEKKRQEKRQQLQTISNEMESIQDKHTSVEANQKEKTKSNLIQYDSTKNLQNSSHTSLVHISDNQYCKYSEYNDNERKNYRCDTADQNNGNSSSDTDFLLIRQNLKGVVYDIVRNMDPNTIALTIVLETDQLYHLSISIIFSGQSLACFFTTEDAIQEAKMQNLFKEFLTLYVVNVENSIAQKNRILGHLFEFIKLDI